MCVNEWECVCVGYSCVCVWSLMSAGGCYCLQMWVLGNHKTQSLWSIPAPLPLYIAFSSSTHNLSPFLFHIHKHTHAHTHFHLFPSIFHLSSASATPHLSSISYSHTHSISVFCYILLRSVVCLPSLDIFLVISLFSPVPSPAAPSPSLTITNTSLLPSSSAPLLPLLPPTSLLYPWCPPPLLPFWLPSHVCTLLKGEYWLHAWLTGTVMDDLKCVCVCTYVCMWVWAVLVVVVCLRNSPGNNSPDRADGRRASRHAGRQEEWEVLRHAAQLDRPHLKATEPNVGQLSNHTLFIPGELGLWTRSTV